MFTFIFSDLSVGLLNVLVDIIWRITVTWEAGNLACKFIKFLQCLTTYASTYVLVALSIDRYDAITHPMNFSGSWKRAKILVVSAWAMSALFSAPQIFLYEETLIQGKRL
jgi:neuropeptide S receptor